MPVNLTLVERAFLLELVNFYLVAKHRADCLRYVADEHAALGKLRGGNSFGSSC